MHLHQCVFYNRFSLFLKGVAKSYSYWMIRNYREAYKMFLCSGILFNHESPRRSESFVTRKVSRSVAKISLGQTENFELGNLNSRRDWGHAKDYVHVAAFSDFVNYYNSFHKMYDVISCVAIILNTVSISIKFYCFSSKDEWCDVLSFWICSRCGWRSSTKNPMILSLQLEKRTVYGNWSKRPSVASTKASSGKAKVNKKLASSKIPTSCVLESTPSSIDP